MQEYSELRKPIKTRIIKTYICKKFRRSWICLHVCVFRKIFEHFCCQYLSQKSDSSFLFLRSFVCLPQFISIQSRQTANYLSCYKIHIYVSQLFISRMHKMRAIPQLVSAPLNLIPIAEHFRRSHPPCEHSHGQCISEENNAK